MKKEYRTLLNITNIIGGAIIIFTGVLIQLNYHMHHLPDNSLILGFDRISWRWIHTLSSIFFLIWLIYHNWINLKTIKAFFLSKKKSPKYHLLSIILLGILLLMAITALLALANNLLDNQEQRFTYIEIHDKIGILMSILLIIHFIQHFSSIKKSIIKLSVDCFPFSVFINGKQKTDNK